MSRVRAIRSREKSALLPLAAILVTGALCHPPDMVSSAEAVDIPDPIVDAATGRLVARVGADFFIAYLRFDLDASRYVEARPDLVVPAGSDERYRQAHYALVFDFRMPQHEFVNEQVFCDVLADGTILKVAAVPDCIADPGECRFPIDEDRARRIARERGLEVGLGEWELGFHWHYSYLTYVWTVSNTLTEEEYRAEGKTVVIDANSGDVREVSGWFSAD